MDIDLSKFDLETGAVHPYQDVVFVGGKFFAYEGAFGKRYRYFEIAADSGAGELCREFWERYYVRNEHRFSYYEDGQTLFSLAERERGVVILAGVKAYYKYWDHFTDQDKLRTNFNVIPYYKALREWYRLRFREMMEKNQRRFLNKEIKEALIQQWIDKLLQEIEVYLQPPAPPVMFSILSMAHTYELSKFHRWVAIKRCRKTTRAYLKLVGRMAVWIMNNATMAAIIGGVIAGLIVILLAKKWHF